MASLQSASPARKAETARIECTIEAAIRAKRLGKRPLQITWGSCGPESELPEKRLQPTKPGEEGDRRPERREGQQREVAVIRPASPQQADGTRRCVADRSRREPQPDGLRRTLGWRDARDQRHAQR